MTVRLQRVYESPSAGDGVRVLVDRLWPRGLSKDRARIDVWLKEIAPSDALRKEFHRDPSRWDAFRVRYEEELDGNPDAVAILRALIAENEVVTLLYGARDERRNQAVVLRERMARNPQRTGKSGQQGAEGPR